MTHCWTSGGEAAAVAEFARAFDATGHKRVDGAITGSGDVARPVIVSRIEGGKPMGATQLNPGKNSDDLIAAGLMQDQTELAPAEDWANILRPKSQIESCTVEGKVCCVPGNLHSGQCMWTNLNHPDRPAILTGLVPLTICLLSGKPFVRAFAASAAKG